MLYLALTLFCTSTSIYNLAFNIFRQDVKATYNNFDAFYHISSCILWSIWYFYYLN